MLKPFQANRKGIPAQTAIKLPAGIGSTAAVSSAGCDALNASRKPSQQAAPRVCAASTDGAHLPALQEL